MKKLALALTLAAGACATASPPPAPPTAAPASPLPPPPATTAWPALAQALATIAAGEDGVVGAAVIHVESGRSADLHGADRFLMASVYKLPIALALLDASERGQLALGEAITISKPDLANDGRPALGGAWTGAPLALPLARLMELMIADSDNTATDVLLRRLGGPPAVGAYLRRVGHGEIRVDRSIHEQRARAEPPADLVGHDPRDTTTPLAIARLLAALARRELSTEAGRAQLLGIMTGPGTQAHRLQRSLPAGTPVAQKSGTATALATNAVGLVTLPAPHGHLAVALFVSRSRRPTPQQEATIAALARAAYDEALR